MIHHWYQWHLKLYLCHVHWINKYNLLIHQTPMNKYNEFIHVHSRTSLQGAPPYPTKSVPTWQVSLHHRSPLTLELSWKKFNFCPFLRNVHMYILYGIYLHVYTINCSIIWFILFLFYLWSIFKRFQNNLFGINNSNIKKIMFSKLKIMGSLIWGLI